MTKPLLEWETVERYVHETATITLRRQSQTKERDPWSVSLKFETGQGESEDFPSEEAARATFNQLLASLGVDMTPVMLEPEHPEQLFATWFTRLHHTRQQMPAQEEVEIAFVADPMVRAHAGELMLMAEGKKGWVYGIMRSCLAGLVKAERANEMQAVRVHQNFGRFG
jgi:hypothetical protein